VSDLRYIVKGDSIDSLVLKLGRPSVRVSQWFLWLPIATFYLQMIVIADIIHNSQDCSDSISEFDLLVLLVGMSCEIMLSVTLCVSCDVHIRVICLANSARHWIDRNPPRVQSISRTV
jgi:hypothetical protein